MKKKLSNLILILSFIFIVNIAEAQPNWYYTNTGVNHTILIQIPSNVTIDGVALTNSDYIGVFYDSLGTIACAGYAPFDTINFAITAWGAQAGVNDGFQAGESFTWKLWRASDSLEFFATPVYMPSPPMPNLGNFLVNGMSGIETLTAIIGSDLAIGNLLSPISGCGLTATEQVSFIVQNVGSVDVDTFVVSFSIDGGTVYYTDTIIQNFTTNSNYTYTSLQNFDLSAQGAYTLDISIYHPLDLTIGNNSETYTIYNSTPPTIDLSGVSTVYCQGIGSIPLYGIPAGGVFGSNDVVILNNSAHFPFPGNFDIFYDFTDTTGCSASDTITVTVNPTPVIELGPELVLCDGDVYELSLPSGFAGYLWSTGSTDTIAMVTQAGIYSATVTNSFNCESSDSVVANYNPLPQANISGDTIACEGDSISLSVAGQGSSYVWDLNGTPSWNDVVTAFTSGLYSVTVSSFGCLGLDSVYITFQPNPVVDLGADQSLCDGESVILDAGNFNTYAWTDGSTDQTFEVLAAGFYSVTVSDNLGCTGEDEVEISLIPMPVAGFDFVVTGLQVDFTNTSTNESHLYSWDFGDSGSSTDENPVYTFANPGSYDVTLIVLNDCGEDTITQTVTLVGIDDIENSGIVSIFPNPSSGVISVEVNNRGADDIKLSVINLLGQRIYFVHEAKTTGTITKNIDLSDQAKGIYILKIESGEINYSKKIVIE
ncbi:MAG: PKD domain-containing protein [Bacteroidota bacterium]|nr:PKD domain-containing protein [Bacteroidota bacterium]